MLTGEGGSVGGISFTLDAARFRGYASRVDSKTPSSPAVPAAPRHACLRHRTAVAGTLASLLLVPALSACGGSGSTPSGRTATVAAARAGTTAPTTPAAPAATTTRTTAKPRHARPHPRRVAPARTSPAHTTPAPAVRRKSHPGVQPHPPAPATRKPGPVAHPVDETAHLVLVSSPGPGRYEQQGTVTGTFDGTMTLDARITGAGIVVDFTANVTGGVVTGHGLAIPTITGGSPIATLKGTATVTGGTGTFAHVRGSSLKVTGTAVLPSGAKATVHLTGTVTY
jgi:hypothetical protein